MKKRRASAICTATQAIARHENRSSWSRRGAARVAVWLAGVCWCAQAHAHSARAKARARLRRRRPGRGLRSHPCKPTPAESLAVSAGFCVAALSLLWWSLWDTRNFQPRCLNLANRSPRHTILVATQNESKEPIARQAKQSGRFCLCQRHHLRGGFRYSFFKTRKTHMSSHEGVRFRYAFFFLFAFTYIEIYTSYLLYCTEVGVFTPEGQYIYIFKFTYLPYRFSEAPKFESEVSRVTPVQFDDQYQQRN